jgi:cytochrome c oxidase subunit 3
MGRPMSFMTLRLMTRHPYHIVDNSPWPLLSSSATLALTVGMVLYMHKYASGMYTYTLGIILLIYSAALWWRDVVREATYEGQHTKQVQLNLVYGMLLFIVSEWMLFFSFFWAFFHSSLAPVPEIGSIWPPKGISVIGPWGIPLLNTVILLSSGATVTCAHHAVISKKRKISLIALMATIALAVVFTMLQLYEYKTSNFTMSDSVYGSTFFITTGFHGLHVLIGTIFLIVSTIRLYIRHTTSEHHFGLEAGIWYWHFVDVVWLLLFISIYWWGGQ